MFSYVYSISASENTNITQVSVFMKGINNSATENTPVDGSVFFVIDQLNFPESFNSSISVQSLELSTQSVDLSSIPTLKLPTGNVVAFLLCEPHVSIQTRQVRATGNGNLTLGKPQRSQGNIDFYQATYLLSNILNKLPTDSGPTSSIRQVGTDMMAQLIFGTNSTGHQVFPDNIPPAPLTNITAMYKQVIQSAMKTVLSGQIATENVPGGYTEEQMVFTASLGHVITSTTLFVFLTIVLVVAQFRKGRATFTLVNVAAALADSDVPQKSLEMMQFKAGTEERKVLKVVLSDDAMTDDSIVLNISMHFFCNFGADVQAITSYWPLMTSIFE